MVTFSTSFFEFFQCYFARLQGSWRCFFFNVPFLLSAFGLSVVAQQKEALSMLLPLFQQISLSCYLLDTCWPCGAGSRGVFLLSWSRLNLRHVLCTFLVILLLLPMAVNFVLYLGQVLYKRVLCPSSRSRVALTICACACFLSLPHRKRLFFLLPYPYPCESLLVPGGNQQSLLHPFQYLMAFIL